MMQFSGLATSAFGVRRFPPLGIWPSNQSRGKRRTPKRDANLYLLLRLTLFLLLFLVPTALSAEPSAAEQAANRILDSARRAYNEKNYSFAAERFREFLAHNGKHKEANSARYGLALCLLEGPNRDYNAVLQQLQPLAADKNFREYPFVLYYLALAERGLGTKSLVEAVAKPPEANHHRVLAQQRFEKASKDFAAAEAAFQARTPKTDPPSKELPLETEWAARARCDHAEMLLRLHKAKEARVVITPFIKDARLRKSRYHTLGLYYHGFACFLLGDNLAAGRSLNLLTPFTDPVFGTHARYLLARVHQATGERQEAQRHYEGVLADYAKHKQAAAEALKRPEQFKNDPEEKERLEQLTQGPPPDHVARATFFLGVLQYEDGHFAEALAQLTAFQKQGPRSSLTDEAQLRQGFCQVQLKQFAEAQKTLQPLVDRQSRLADQAFLWLAKAQSGAADPANPEASKQALQAALGTYRQAADRAQQLAGSDPGAKTRRGEILLEMADTQQLAHQHKEAAATYNQILNEKLLPERGEEILQRVATAWHLAEDYNEADKACELFQKTYPKSVLLPEVLFRHAENAYFKALAAEKLPNPADRQREKNRWNDEAIKRYQVIVDRYPEFTHANLARYGLAMAHYHKGELEKAKEKLEAIPAAERMGDLAVVSYQLAEILIRQAPARADDAVAAGRLEEQLKTAAELLENFAASQPKGPQTADALFKLGHCQQRLAALLAQPADQVKVLAAARAAYEQLLQRFPNDPLQPSAHFERAKVLAQAKDIHGAINELRRFFSPPLSNAPIAPMALLHLATLLRGQNQPQEAANVLAQCRQQHEPSLQADPTRSGWIPLLQYHHGIALREAGKRKEAQEILALVSRQAPAGPEAADALLRAGQCLKDEAQAKISEGYKRLAPANLRPEERAAAQASLDEGLRQMREAEQFFVVHAAQLQQRQPASEARARMLYEAAWASRVLAEAAVAVARRKMQQDLWQKQRDEAAKQVPPGQPPPFVPVPDVSLAKVPMQPAEQQTRAHYQALIQAFPDLNVNADARFELAELLSERGEHDAAIKLLKEAIDKEPAPELMDKVRVRLGDCLLRKGDTKAALAQLETVAGNSKSALAAQAKYRIGECYLQQGEPAEAVKHLSVFRDQGPYQKVVDLSDRALLRLGFALGQLKQWEPSRQAYETLLSRFGNSRLVPEAHYGAGWALQQLSQYDNAVKHYNQVITTVVTELAARAQMNVGLCRLAQKRYAEASTALLVVPFTYDYADLSALSLVEAARAFSENKQPEQAIKLLERVLRDHPNTESAEVARKRLAELKPT
jgi:TolA-binding protein